MKCEYCEQEHDGSYGSGRFCNKECAHGFSTKAKRKEINKKVSISLSGRKSWTSSGFKKGFDKRRNLAFSEVSCKKRSNSLKKHFKNKYKSKCFNELSGKYSRKRRILEEQNFKCNRCGLDKWLGQNIKFELEHKDGNKLNNDRNNLEVLCPNCHSLTPWWRVSHKNKMPE